MAKKRASKRASRRGTLQPPAQTQTPIAAEPPETATTLREAVNELAELASNLERSWSEALDNTTLLREGQEQYRGQISGITQILEREITKQTQVLIGLGLNTTIEFSMPMSDLQLQQALAASDISGEFLRNAIARQFALVDLLAIFGAMFEKPNVRYSEVDGMTRWRSSGAFALIGDKAQLVLDLNEEGYEIVRRAAGVPTEIVRRRIGAMTDHLPRAHRALGSGQPLPSLAYLLATLRARLLDSGEPTAAAVGAHVSELAAACPSLSGIASALAEAGAFSRAHQNPRS